MAGGALRDYAALSDIIVRPGASADLPHVVSMERACYGDPWPESAFAALPDNPRVYFAVAHAGKPRALVGYAVAWYVLDEGELANLAVSPTHRGQGIGSRLLERALADAGERRVTQMFLEVRESNASARKLYSRYGFVEIGRRKEYYRKPLEDALILCRRVAG